MIRSQKWHQGLHCQRAHVSFEAAKQTSGLRTGSWKLEEINSITKNNFLSIIIIERNLRIPIISHWKINLSLQQMFYYYDGSHTSRSHGIITWYKPNLTPHSLANGQFFFLMNYVCCFGVVHWGIFNMYCEAVSIFLLQGYPVEPLNMKLWNPSRLFWYQNRLKTSI